MDSTNAISLPSRIKDYISKHRLRDAFKLLRSFSAKLGDWRITDKIDHLEESYRMMLNYASQGVVDPQRDEMYNMIVSGMYGIMDNISRRLSLPKSPSVYFATVRYEELQPDSSLNVLLGKYRRIIEETSLYNLLTNPTDTGNQSNKDKEELERRIFNKVWTAYPLTRDEESELRALFGAEDLPSYFKELIVSAVMLGALQYYQESRLLILLDVYAQSASVSLSLKALCAFLLAAYINREQVFSAKVENRIKVLRDSTFWSSDVPMVFLQFIKSRETEKINKKMRDEVIPEMMKLRTDIKNFKNITSIEDIASIEENPEWQDLLDKTGLTDKIKELTKMQEEGGDVFMSTFSSLKNYPFFNDVANWFLPFHVDHSAVKNVLGESHSPIADITESSQFFCDGDKYSFLLTLESVPPMQRKMMMSQFDSLKVQESMMKASELSSTVKERENVANFYIQDLYRFFKLYRRKGDFADPFVRPVNLLQLPLLAEDFIDTETLEVVSEFYFKRSYFEDALDVFKKLEDKGLVSAQMYQKMGFCSQHIGNLQEALKYYENAEMLNADSLWTLRRLAAVHRLSGNSEKAMEYYKKIELQRPDDLTVAMNLGNCALDAGDTAEALKYYYKVEFLDEKKAGKVWRPMAWALFLNGDMEQSKVYFDKILSDNPTVNDYLNMGHHALASGDIKGAINFYCLSIDSNNGDCEAFVTLFNHDLAFLDKAGVPSSIIPLVIDGVLYRY